jgi:hypothetical protein
MLCFLFLFSLGGTAFSFLLMSMIPMIPMANVTTRSQANAR